MGSLSLCLFSYPALAVLGVTQLQCWCSQAVSAPGAWSGQIPGCHNALENARSPGPELPAATPCPDRNAQSQRLFLYNCLYKFNKGKTASGRSTKTTPYNNGTYECRILQSGNNHVINLKWELNSHFKERETTFDHLFYCWTHCIN